jgi:hypothetical protein
MASKLSVTESKFLERVRTTLTNVENHPVIKSAMGDFGMDEGNLAQGREFYEQARTSKERSEREEKETRLSWNAYEEAFDEFRADYAKHREFVRVFYKGNKELLIKLGMRGRLSNKYNEVFDKGKSFYTVAQEDPLVQERLSQVRVTPDVVAESLAKLERVLALRSHYDKEAGESQEITQNKNTAMKKLKTWLSRFDAAAKIALYDKPQLREVLGIFVRS